MEGGDEGANPWAVEVERGHGGENLRTLTLWSKNLTSVLSLAIPIDFLRRVCGEEVGVCCLMTHFLSLSTREVELGRSWLSQLHGGFEASLRYT